MSGRTRQQGFSDTVATYYGQFSHDVTQLKQAVDEIDHYVMLCFGINQ